MEVSKTVVESIDLDLATYEDYIQELSALVLEQKVSKYPIFVMHQQSNLEIGRTVIDSQRSKTKWSVNVSHLEEFVNRKIVSQENVNNFTEVYKDPRLYICIFVLSEDKASFIFRPFTVKQN